MWYLTFSRPAVPREQIAPHLQEHLDWQRRMHESGRVLFSGPSGDRTMGIILVRASSLEDAHDLLDTEPFHARGLRTYEVIEWDVHQGLGLGGFSGESLALLAREKDETSA